MQFGAFLFRSQAEPWRLAHWPPDQGKKVVQQLEDGIIAELRVHDGDVVKPGQPLVVLEDVQTRANYDALQQQSWSQLAKQARLQAESEHLSKIEWPAELQLSNPKIAAIIDAQRMVFETRSVELITKKIFCVSALIN